MDDRQFKSQLGMTLRRLGRSPYDLRPFRGLRGFLWRLWDPIRAPFTIESLNRSVNSPAPEIADAAAAGLCELYITINEDQRAVLRRRIASRDSRTLLHFAMRMCVRALRESCVDDLRLALAAISINGRHGDIGDLYGKPAVCLFVADRIHPSAVELFEEFAQRSDEETAKRLMQILEMPRREVEISRYGFISRGSGRSATIEFEPMT